MKNKITNLTQALTYVLEGMYDSEKKTQRDLPELIEKLKPGGIKKLAVQYLESSKDKRLKLKRIFSYVLAGPFGRKSKVTAKSFEEINEAIKITGGSAREVLVLSGLESLMEWKLAAYTRAADIAAHVDLDAAAGLLEEITGWEKESLRQLRKINTKKIELAQKELLTVAP
jgi:ferritin-like metal-binding protein YciE